MRRTLGSLALSAALLTGCGSAGTAQHAATSASDSRQDVHEVKLPGVGEWAEVDGGRARLASVRWEDAPPNTAGRPVWGAWLVCTIEIQAAGSRPLPVSVWNWHAIGAYDGELANTQQWGNGPTDLSLPPGASLSGEYVAFDVNPGQASIVQWQPAATDTAASFLVPAR